MSGHTAVLDCSVLAGTDCRCAVPVVTAKCRQATTATTPATSRVRRRLQFDDDDDDDAGRQKSSAESSQTVLDYVNRLYNDQTARWNMEFGTLTPLKGGRWEWDRVQVTSPSRPVVDTHSCSTVSRNITAKKRGRKIIGKQ